MHSIMLHAPLPYIQFTPGLTSRRFAKVLPHLGPQAPLRHKEALVDVDRQLPRAFAVMSQARGRLREAPQGEDPHRQVCVQQLKVLISNCKAGTHDGYMHVLVLNDRAPRYYYCSILLVSRAMPCMRDSDQHDMCT